VLLAIETSCDETAVALFSGDSLIPIAEALATQTKLHEAYGGVVPELAAREHLLALPILFKQVLAEAKITSGDLSSVAVTMGPGLQGCLLVGVSFAKALAVCLGIPLIPIHHIEGHIAASALIPGHNEIAYPALALVVSGGHTMLVELESFRKYRVVAETRDDAAGEAFDKIASLLHLPYPGGPSLSRVAQLGNPKRFDFPIALPNDLSSFSFSGLKTSVARMVQKFTATELTTELVADIAASAEAAIVAALVEKTVKVAEQSGIRSLVLTGGVAANGRLRTVLSERAGLLGIPVFIPPSNYCTDNAAMIGTLAQQILRDQAARYRSWKPGADLGPDAPSTIGPRARWPLSDSSTHAAS
jgi:N6-L-threonylcarbamoyladenine synthase